MNYCPTLSLVVCEIPIISVHQTGGAVQLLVGGDDIYNLWVFSGGCLTTKDRQMWQRLNVAERQFDKVLLPSIVVVCCILTLLHTITRNLLCKTSLMSYCLDILSACLQVYRFID